MGIIKHSITVATEKIERSLGLDLGYYVRNNFYLITTQLIVLLCGLATSITMARLLPKEVYGQYNYIFSIINILAISSLPGMGAAILQAVANGHDQALITGTKTRIKWSIIGAVLCLFIGLYYYSSGEVLLGTSFVSISLFFPLYTSFDNIYPFLSGRKRFDLYSYYRSGYWIVLALAIILAVYLSKNLLWIVIVYMATATVIESSFFFNTIRTGNLNRSEDKAAMTYGKQLTGIQAMGIAVLQFDKLIVGLALGFSQLAIYSIASMIANIASILTVSLSTTILPKIAVMEDDVAYSEVKRRLPWLILGMVIICGIGTLLCPYVIPWLYTQKYLDSVLYTQLLFIPVIVGTPALILRRGVLQARKKTRELFKINVAVSVFEVAMLALLALNFGLLGIVIARILARALDSGYSWALTR
ncbi:lipopolysaccharide biosynthesis protein [Chloroflexota bacterium]